MISSFVSSNCTSSNSSCDRVNDVTYTRCSISKLTFLLDRRAFTFRLRQVVQKQPSKWGPIAPWPPSKMLLAIFNSHGDLNELLVYQILYTYAVHQLYLMSQQYWATWWVSFDVTKICMTYGGSDHQTSHFLFDVNVTVTSHTEVCKFRLRDKSGHVSENCQSWGESPREYSEKQGEIWENLIENL